MAELKVIILAAGKSTRMKSDTPKVLHEVAGKPILRYVLEQAASLDPIEIVCVVGHQAERVKEAFQDFPKLSFVEQTEQLGTAHAVLQARAALDGFDGDVLILCGDVPLLKPATLAAFYQQHIDASAKASVLTAVVADPTGYGRIIRDSADEMREIIEEKDCPDELKIVNEINSGTYLFSAPFLIPTLDQVGSENAQGEFYLPDAVHVLVMQQEKVGSLVVGDELEIIGVNNRRDLARADSAARGYIMIDLLEQGGVTIIDPATTYIDADVTIGRDSIIRPYTCIRAGVKIGEHCEIGPFSHVRPGTVLEDDTKVGAFVETKNALMRTGAKAGHMAYLGDVEIGKDVNIGAGTIIANYDGKQKHKTVIEDEAFVGCGTVLVAPVKVGKGAVTGANTVVPKNKDVPPGSTVVGAPAKEIKRK